MVPRGPLVKLAWNDPYRKPIHYYDCILIKHSQPQLMFHFQMMWEIYCRGVQELKTLQLIPQCVFNKKTKNTWTTLPLTTWESWIMCITFSTIPLFFCNDFFWVFTHTFWTINISGFGKWSYLNNIHLDNCYWCKCFYIFSLSGFTSHFTTISANNSITTLGGWQ